MDRHTRFEELKSVAARLSIEVKTGDLSDDELFIRSGHCKVHGRDLIILHRGLDMEQQAEVILDVLKRFDLEAVYVPAWIRERVDNEPTVTEP